MAKTRYDVYEVRRQGRLPLIVTCRLLIESDDELDFVADGVTVVRVPRAEAEWVLRSRNGTRPGARRSRSPLAALNAATSGIANQARKPPPDGSGN
jgi:hypothetical protein